MTKTPFDKIAEGLQEAISIAQGLSKFLPEDMFPAATPTEEPSPPVEKRVGRIEISVNGLVCETFEFDRQLPLDMGEAMEFALDFRDQLLNSYSANKIKLKIKGAK